MRILAVVALVLATAPAHALTPLPTRADHSVYDAAGVIDAATEARLEALDTELFAKAGVAMVVVTVPKLDGETIDQLAVRVQHDWGVGAKGKDESVVVAVAIAERKIFIATGYGSEGYLPDGKVGEIRDRARPLLAANDYAHGLLQIAQEIAPIAAAAHQVALDDSVRPTAAPVRDTGCGSTIPTLVFFAVFAVIALLGRRGGGGGGLGAFLPGVLLGSMFGRGRGGGGDLGGGGGGGFGGFGGGSGGGGGAGGDF